MSELIAKFVTPYLFWIKLAGAVLAVAGIFASGMWLDAKIKDSIIAGMQRDAALAEAAARKDAAARQSRADQVTHDTDVANAAAHQKIVTGTQNILQKVPNYVTAQTDTAYPLPCGFVRLHDAAAAGVDPAAVPIPADKSDADRCDVTASYAAAIIAGNYGLALGWQADLKAWITWYEDQSAIWNAGLNTTDTKEK